MILRFAAASPFVRKVRIAAALVGLQDSITLERADTTDISDSVRRQNPLGKIPALILDNGDVLYDSRVIVEYLDVLAGAGRLIPLEREPRFEALRMQALADGLMDAAVLHVYESRWRPAEKHEAKWMDHQSGKRARALDVLEADPPGISAAPHIGQVAVACALSYLDFRLEGAWRSDHPRMVAWLDGFAAAVPSFSATAPA